MKNLIYYAPFIRIKEIKDDSVLFEDSSGNTFYEDSKIFLQNITPIVGHTRITQMVRDVENFPIAPLDRAAQKGFYINSIEYCPEDPHNNKYGLPNIGIISNTGNVIVYSLPLGSITERYKIPEYYVSITNRNETFIVSANKDGTVVVSKINEENKDEKLLLRYKEIDLEDRISIVQNLIDCYTYDDAIYPEDETKEITDIKQKIISGLKIELEKLQEEQKTRMLSAVKQEVYTPPEKTSPNAQKDKPDQNVFDFWRTKESEGRKIRMEEEEKQKFYEQKRKQRRWRVGSHQ